MPSGRARVVSDEGTAGPRAGMAQPAMTVRAIAIRTKRSDLIDIGGSHTVMAPDARPYRPAAATVDDDAEQEPFDAA